MIPLYNTSQIRNLDSYAIKNLHIPGIVLMENASIGIYEAISEKFNSIKKIGIVCGKGNNGGDGFAVARHLSNAGFAVKVISIGRIEEMSEDCKINFTILSQLSYQRNNLKIKSYKTLKDVNWLKDSDLIVDAMLGSGFQGTLKEPYLSIVNSINKINTAKCAIDVPTGLNSETGYGESVFKSDLTVTLGELKKGLFVVKGYENCGDIDLKEIGIGRDYFDFEKTSTFLIEPEDIYLNLPKREKRSNKYSSGKVLTIAGSFKYPGAAVLSSKSALIAGAGASVLAIPESAKKLVHKNILEVVVESYGKEENRYLELDDLQTLNKKISWTDVVAIGPGIGREKETIAAVRKLLLERKFKFAVVDADALFAISKDFLRGIDLSDCILTPHYGEFSKLLGIDVKEIEKDILKYGREFATKNNCILVLKGAPTITFNSDGESFINSTGNPGLAKFGSGDVLTGIISGLLSQLKNPELSAILGVYLHSLSADLLLAKKPISNYLASDVMNNYPNAVKFIEKSFA